MCTSPQVGARIAATLARASRVLGGDGLESVDVDQQLATSLSPAKRPAMS